MPAHERSTDALARPLRFGPGGRFELRPAEYRLLVDGQPATLGGRALDLLMALAARPSELHTKSALLDSVWAGLVVEEGNLRVQINALRRLLGEDAIATVPGRGYRFSAPLHPDPHPDPHAVPDATAPTLTPALAPAATPTHPPLFGRDADLAHLQHALRDGSGCVTLVGTPGVGKSSLARAAMARWPARSAWVDLAPLTQPGQVAGAIARALGGQLGAGDPAPQVLCLLPEGEALLLVLDNAEHLIAPCAEWVVHLRGAPSLQLLVTSQLPLAVDGERVLRLEPLHVAEGVEGPDAHEGALALLIHRIRAADSRFDVTPKSLPLLAALCRQLDGLPLALEMAAARVPLMGLQAVHDALAERFALLSRGRRDSAARHRSLLAALDWSYQLLEAPEQRLFRALGVFAGGFTLDLAVTLTSDEHVGRWDIVDGLATLVERSLVSVNGEDPPRYRLLETMRAYALGKLASPDPGAADGADEARSLRRRHAAAVLALIAGSDAQPLWLADMENVREAFLWAREHDLAAAAQLGARAARVMVFSVWRQEITDWMVSLQPAMQQAAGQALAAPTQALWWSMLGYLLGIRLHPQARPAARHAVALWRPLGNPTELQIAIANWIRAFIEPVGELRDELDEACAALREVSAGDDTPLTRLRVNGALAVAARLRYDTLALLACNEQELLAARELGLHAKAQAAENNICVSLVRLGRHAEAAVRAQALLQRVDADGGDGNGNLPWVLNVLVEALVGLGRLPEAAALVPRSLATGRRFGTSVAWLGILLLVAAQHRAEAAGRLAGHVRRQWTANGATLDPVELHCLAQATAAAEARLGAEATAALAAEGHALSDEAAAALAVGDAG
ncbi:winged helix-turn-helix domain-containing protein [Aquincola sp. S2]|uniref:Winged helix-turn-helix domain-containing protein n=1 Tax=Pseudaquabacterium terrae TaxID=2732868 RepID=A0ABX2ERY6_9BURK|nr:winged helix-turn-helix domain-containing protein [Aquabacterium terrae]NRF71505.1 winged helix-turn-helix domain-containing protein [Aquabacterium terrae]